MNKKRKKKTKENNEKKKENMKEQKIKKTHKKKENKTKEKKREEKPKVLKVADSASYKHAQTLKDHGTAGECGQTASSLTPREEERKKENAK